MLAFKVLGALGLSLALSYGGYKKKSLDLSGALSAIIVGFVTTLASFRFAGELCSLHPVIRSQFNNCDSCFDCLLYLFLDSYEGTTY